MKRVEYIVLGCFLTCVVLVLGVLAAASQGIVPKEGKWLVLVVLVVGPLLVFGEAIVEVVCGLIGAVALPLVTLGRARIEQDGDQLDRLWQSVGHGTDGKLVIAQELVPLVGIGIVIAVVATYVCAVGLVR